MKTVLLLFANILTAVVSAVVFSKIFWSITFYLSIKYWFLAWVTTSVLVESYFYNKYYLKFSWLKLVIVDFASILAVIAGFVGFLILALSTMSYF